LLKIEPRIENNKFPFEVQKWPAIKEDSIKKGQELVLFVCDKCKIITK